MQYRKEAMNQSTKHMQNWSKEIKSDNFCYRKVGRAITTWGSIEKSPILLSQYWKNSQFELTYPISPFKYLFLRRHVSYQYHLTISFSRIDNNIESQRRKMYWWYIIILKWLIGIVKILHLSNIAIAILDFSLLFPL